MPQVCNCCLNVSSATTLVDIKQAFMFAYYGAQFPQEIQEGILTCLTNNEFMSLFDDAGEAKTQLLRDVAESYLQLYSKDGVDDMTGLLPGCHKAVKKLKGVFSGLLVLLDPVPGVAEVSTLSTLLAYEDDKLEKDNNPFAKAVSLCLQSASWQKRVDEVLKTASGTMKLGGTVEKLTASLQAEEGFEVSGSFREAVQMLSEMRRVLRKGATRVLEKILCLRLKAIIEWTLKQDVVTGMASDHVQILLHGLHYFSGDNTLFLELETNLKQWSGKMAKKLGWQNLQELVQSMEDQRQDGAEVAVQYGHIRELLDGVGEVTRDEDGDVLRRIAKITFLDIQKKAP